LEESQRPEVPVSKRPAAKIIVLRVLVGVVLIPLVLGLTYAGGLVYAAFVGLLAGLGSYELLAMASRAGYRPGKTLGILGSAALAFSFVSGNQALPSLALTIAIVAALIERLARSSKERYLADTSVTVWALVYPGWLLGYFLWLRNLPLAGSGAIPSARLETGVVLVYLVLILTWSYDSVAYVVGSAVGRHKLFPRISPSKTVEGALGGVAGSVAAALISRATLAPFLRPGEAVLLGVLLGAAAQAGDVVESMFKRSMGAKDSSNLIPGHGGFLDRFDSLLFTGPVFYLYARIAL
jgi:phosphatidate cytidylyltransferase